MEIRHFVTLQRIVDTGSFSKAAGQLGYTQSTVTSHIQALEREIGLPLFDRIGRQVKLTEVGEKLLPYTRELLEVYEKIENIGNVEEVRGELRIAAPESITVYRLEPVLRAYRKHFPLVKIKLRNGSCGDNKRLLLHGEADVAFLVMPLVEDEELVVHRLKEESVVVVGSADRQFDEIDDAIANGKLEEPIIVNERDCVYRTMLEDDLARRGVVPSQTMELWSIEAIKRCVISGLGISLLPRMTVDEELGYGSLKLIRAKGEFAAIYSQMAVHRKKWVSPALAAFIRIVSDHAGRW